MKNKSPKFALAPLLILLIGFGLRLLDSASRSLWFDEAIEYLTAAAPFSQLSAAVVASNYQPPLNSYLLHFWLQIEIQPLWIRYLYIALSMLTLAGLMRWAGYRWGKMAGLIAGLITAVMPTEIYYAQDIGEYALLVCLLTYSLYYLDRAVHEPGWQNWALWALFSVGSVFTHYGAVIIIIPIALVVFLRNSQRRDWLRVKYQAVLMGVSALASLPLIFYFLPQQIRRVSDNVLANPFTSISQELWQGLTAVTKTFSYNLTGYPLSTLPLAVSLVTIFLFGLLALAFSLSHWRKSPLLWLLLPYIFYFGLVRVGLYAGFGLRYALIFTPLLIMVLVWVIVRLIDSPTPLAGWLLLIGLLLVQLYASPHPTLSQLIGNEAAWSPQEDLQSAFNYWQYNRTADDITFVYYGAVPAMRYYLQLSGLDQAGEDQTVTECSAANRQPVCQENHLYFEPWARPLTTEGKIAEMFGIIGETPQSLWLLFSHVHQNEEKQMIEYLQTQYSIVEAFHPGNPVTASAYLLERNTP